MRLEDLPACYSCSRRMTPNGFAVVLVQGLSRRNNDKTKSGCVCPVSLSFEQARVNDLDINYSHLGFAIDSTRRELVQQSTKICSVRKAPQGEYLISSWHSIGADARERLYVEICKRDESWYRCSRAGRHVRPSLRCHEDQHCPEADID